MNRRHTLAALTAIAWPLGAMAQAAFPNKPITVVVRATPGGAIDLAAHLIGARLSAAWGQPVALENVGGAAGMLGSDRVAKAVKGYETSTWCGAGTRRHAEGRGGQAQRRGQQGAGHG